MLALKLLGIPKLELNGAPIPFKTNKSQALLYYLVTMPGFHSRDLLADLLWPQMQTQQARKNLRDALSQLRIHIGDYLRVDNQKLAFVDTLPYQSDVADFRRQVEHGRQVDDLATIEKGLALYQGKFLAGFRVLDAQPFDHWVTIQREMLHSLALAAMEWLANAYFQQGAYAASIEQARRVLDLDPCQESVHRLLMELYTVSGQRTAAIRQYEQCRQRLQSALGLLPSAETELLYTQIRAGQLATERAGQATHRRPLATPPASPAHPSQHNLPRTLTPLVGRTSEIAALCTLLAVQNHPLLTVVGEGGIGKTRLVLAVGQRLLAEVPTAAGASPPEGQPALVSVGASCQPSPYKDGIWFVDLNTVGPTTNAADASDAIAVAISDALQVTFPRQEQIGQQLQLYLHNKTMLLILDSFEHLYAGRLFLVDLLQGAPGLQILVTSRRRLELAAEYLFEIAGLTIPAQLPLSSTNGSLTVAQLLEHSAIRLFCTCAQRIGHDFQLTAGNADAVVEICQLLGGSPLAIELAVTQLSVYNVQTLATRLRADLQMLTSTRADLPPRQQNMATVLAVTWQLLAPEEAEVLAQAALLNTSFTLEALQVVTGATRSQIRQIVHLALLHYDNTADQFTWHPLVRQYAATQLALAPARKATAAERHAEYYLSWLQQQERTLFATINQMAQIQRHWENISAAWDWSIENERLDLLVRGAQTFCRIYRLFDLLKMGVVRIENAIGIARRHLQRANNQAAQRALAHLLACSLELYHHLAQEQMLEAVAHELRSWGQQLDEINFEVVGLLALSRACEIRDDYANAIVYARQGLALLAPDQAPVLQIQGHLLVTGAALVLGQLEQSFQSGMAALRYLQQAPNHIHEADLYFHLALICRRRQEYTAAFTYLTRAAALSSPVQRAQNRIFIADLFCIFGDYTQAKTIYEEVLVLYQSYTKPPWESWLYGSYGRLLHLTGRHAEARTYYERVLVHYAYEPLAVGRALLYTAALLTETGELAAAATRYQQLQQLMTQLTLIYGVADLYAGWSVLALHQGDRQQAATQVDAALAELATQGAGMCEEPFQVYWQCYTVRHALGDERAAVILREATQLIQTQAAALTEPTLRHTFLTNIAAVVALLKTWQPVMSITANANLKIVGDANDFAPSSAD